MKVEKEFDKTNLTGVPTNLRIIVFNSSLQMCYENCLTLVILK